MNWDAVGATAELLGALGVIASLLYLAAQVRSSTAATKAAAGEAATTAFREVLAPVSSDPKVCGVFGAMFEDLDGLAGVERQQAFHLMFQFWKAAESVHYHHSHGMLDPNTWVSWEVLLKNYVNSPGFQTYWGVRSSVYSRAFQEWVAANMEHQDGETSARL